MTDCAEQYYAAWIEVFDGTPKNYFAFGKLIKHGEENLMNLSLLRKIGSTFIIYVFVGRKIHK